MLRDVGLAEEREDDEEGEEERVWLHCVVGEKLELEEGDGDVETNVVEVSSMLALSRFPPSLFIESSLDSLKSHRSHVDAASMPS